MSPRSQIRETLARWLRPPAVWFTVGAYMLAAPFGCLVFVLLSFLWRRDPVRRTRRLQRVTVRAYRFMHDWLRWVNVIDFDHRRPIGHVPDGPCVVVSNHVALTDITSISAAIGGGFSIVKPQLFRRRLLNTLLVGAGHLEGPEADLVTIGRVVEEAVQRLEQGFRLIVFPEGTRSEDGRLLPFGRTPFEIACRAGVPIVSLTVRSDPGYLTKAVPVYRPPHPTSRLRLGVLAIDHPESVGGDSRELRLRVERRYRAWVEGETPAEPPQERSRTLQTWEPRKPTSKTG